MDTAEITARLALAERYPRSAGYDPLPLMEEVMGPNPLPLMEHLTDVVKLEPDMRVMDLGCGRAFTSMFLAREFGVHVHAVDLWISPTENWPRIVAAGLEDRVTPIYADATALPFAEGYYDAILSVDAYHYFGTEPGYLPEIVRFLRPGGRLGHVSPGLSREVDEWPERLARHAEDDFVTFRSAGWWRDLWEAPGLVDVDHAEFMPDGGELWLTWAETWDAWAAATEGQEPYEKEVAMLRDDVDGLLGFVAVAATKR